MGTSLNSDFQMTKTDHLPILDVFPQLKNLTIRDPFLVQHSSLGFDNSNLIHPYPAGLSRSQTEQNREVLLVCV